MIRGCLSSRSSLTATSSVTSSDPLWARISTVSGGAGHAEEPVEDVDPRGVDPREDVDHRAGEIAPEGAGEERLGQGSERLLGGLLDGGPLARGEDDEERDHLAGLDPGSDALRRHLLELERRRGRGHFLRGRRKRAQIDRLDHRSTLPPRSSLLS